MTWNNSLPPGVVVSRASVRLRNSTPRRPSTDAYISEETDPNALYTLADRLDLAGYYDADELQEISEAYLTGEDGEVIARALAPVVTRWKTALVSASNKAEREEVLAFRSNARAYQHAWDFLSQIIDYQDVTLHRRAIVAGLLVRNLHTEALIETIDTSGVELVGVAVVAKSLDEDHAIEGSPGTDLPAPAYDGERGGGAGGSPAQVAMVEAIDRVNELFAASGLDLGDGSGEAWTRAVWGVLSDDEEVAAMAAENTDEQLKASPKFKDKVTGALVAVAADSAVMTEAAMSNPDLYEGLVELLAKVTAIVNAKDAA